MEIIFIAALKANVTKQLLHIKEMIKGSILKCNKENGISAELSYKSKTHNKTK